jgi:hypothetical protein
MPKKLSQLGARLAGPPSLSALIVVLNLPPLALKALTPAPLGPLWTRSARHRQTCSTPGLILHLQLVVSP